MQNIPYNHKLSDPNDQPIRRVKQTPKDLRFTTLLLSNLRKPKSRKERRALADYVARLPIDIKTARISLQTRYKEARQRFEVDAGKPLPKRLRRLMRPGVRFRTAMRAKGHRYDHETKDWK